MITQSLFYLLLGMCACGASPLSEYERKIVAATLVLEAGNEGVEGMKAVLNVIHNRSGDKLKKIVPTTVKYGQFSSLNSVTHKRNPDYSPILRKAYRHRGFNKAIQLVRRLERGKLKDNTFGATHFHSTDIDPPYWTDSTDYLTTIGKHRFYVDRMMGIQSNNL